MRFVKNIKGVSLIEVVVCVAIFAILIVSIYGVFTSIIKGIGYYREKTTVSSLADQYLEIARNMPYSQIGNPVNQANLIGVVISIASLHVP